MGVRCSLGKSSTLAVECIRFVAYVAAVPRSTLRSSTLAVEFLRLGTYLARPSAAAKSEIRNPNLEIRNKHKLPKFKCSKRLARAWSLRRSCLEFRIWDFEFVSDFAIRILNFAHPAQILTVYSAACAHIGVGWDSVPTGSGRSPNLLSVAVAGSVVRETETRDRCAIRANAC